MRKNTLFFSVVIAKKLLNLENKRYKECLEITWKGLELSHCKFIYIYAHDLHATKGTALYQLDNENEATYHFRRAYEFYCLLGCPRTTKALDEYLIRLGINLDTITYDVTQPQF